MQELPPKFRLAVSQRMIITVSGANEKFVPALTIPFMHTHPFMGGLLMSFAIAKYRTPSLVAGLCIPG
jgi:hypothetical protein